MPLFKEVVLALPRVALLLPKLAVDDRVSLRTRLALAGLAVSIASPWDLIPDFIPILGQLDDIMALLLLLDGTLNQVGDSVLLDHWTGEVKTLRWLQRMARLASVWVPTRVKELLFGRAVATGEKRLRDVVAARG